MKKILYIATLSMGLLLTGCSDFLDDQKPQGVLTDDEVKSGTGL